MKIAVLGGTFNPLHKGHEMIARSVCEELGYEKVLFVPSYIPPHKQINCSVTAEERLRMVQVFCHSEKSGRFVCEPCEIERGGVSYTSETLEFIAEKYSKELSGKPAFILGEESAAEFHKWKNPERIAEIADLIVAVRKQGTSGNLTEANVPCGKFDGDFSTAFDEKTFGFPFIKLGNPEMKVSSSEIRSLIALGKSFEHLVPESIAGFIKETGLYK